MMAITTDMVEAATKTRATSSAQGRVPYEQYSAAPAVFPHRMTRLPNEVGAYLNHASRIRMVPFVAAAIQRLNGAGLRYQSHISVGVGRRLLPGIVDYTPLNELRPATRKVAQIDAIYYLVPVLPPHTSRRKV